MCVASQDRGTKSSVFLRGYLRVYSNEKLLYFFSYHSLFLSSCFCWVCKKISELFQKKHQMTYSARPHVVGRVVHTHPVTCDNGSISLIANSHIPMYWRESKSWVNS